MGKIVPPRPIPITGCFGLQAQYASSKECEDTGIPKPHIKIDPRSNNSSRPITNQVNECN
jgi:hypothetical protein